MQLSGGIPGTNVYRTETINFKAQEVKNVDGQAHTQGQLTSTRAGLMQHALVAVVAH